MAKTSIKKPKFTPEEQMAELARLTGSVAAISHMGTSQPFVLPGAAPAPETAAATPTPTAPAPEPAAVPVEAAPPVPAVKPEPPVTVTPIAASEPVSQPATPAVPAASATTTEPKREKALAIATPVPPIAPVAELPAEDDQDEEGAKVVPTPAATEVGKDKLDLTSLFAESAEKKSFQVRITASHQQFFQQMGLLLGGGASSTDVIHNILAQFKAANEEQIQKAFQRQLRQMMSPKK